MKQILDYVLSHMLLNQSSQAAIYMFHHHESLLVIVITFKCLNDIRAAVEHHEAGLDNHFCFLFRIFVLVLSTKDTLSTGM